MTPEQSAEPGHLYIVATPIGNLQDFSQRAHHILETADCVACEDTRVTGKLLAHLGLKKDMVPYHDANEKDQALQLVDRLKGGNSVALVSDAGTPAISDPGFRIVRACRKEGLPVIPIPGPCAFIAVLSASGLPTNAHFYAGFLAPKKSARVKFFEQYQEFPHTIALYESSHRIMKFLDDLVATLGGDRTICVAREVTKKFETFLVGKSAEVTKSLSKQSQKGEFTVLISPEGFEL